MTDLFGRTAKQLRKQIAAAKRRFAVTQTYGGNEGLAQDIARARRSIELDERQLQMIESGVDPKLPESYPDSLTGEALKIWRRILVTGRRY